MARITELPDDPKYTIKSVSSQTGIRPVTLRAWERRHEVLSPHRADNRYRLYSERDIAILRWLKNRVEEGVSISNAVGELRSMAGKNMWPEAIPDAPKPSIDAKASPPAQFAAQLFHALMRHDESKAGDILREAHAIFSLTSIFMEIIVPCLRDIGEAWYRGEIRVATEHFASSFLRGKLLSLLQVYPTRRGAPSILVGCAPMEQHELGSLMLSVLLRSEGYRVEYLGPDVPVEDLADYAKYELPAMVIMSASLEDSAYELRSLQSLLKKNRAPAIFGYGGRAFDLTPTLREKVPGIYLGSTLEEALEKVKGLLKKREK